MRIKASGIDLIRIETALKVLSLWCEEKGLSRMWSINRRTLLRWKAIGIVQHDRILNGEPAPPIPLLTFK